MAKKIYEKEGLDYYHYDDLTKKYNYAGYSNLYISENWNESTLVNEAKLEVYKDMLTVI